MDNSSSPCKKTPKSCKPSFSRKFSIGHGGDAIPEKQPILSGHNRDSYSSPMPSEVIVKVDGAGEPEASASASAPHPLRNVNRESSLGFWGDGSSPASMGGMDFLQEDPPSKLIGVFLQQQRAAGGELRLDVDLEMDEFRPNRSYNNPSSNLPPPSPNYYDPNSRDAPSASPNNRNFSYGDDYDDDDDVNRKLHNRRRSSNLETPPNNQSQVLKCTSIQKRVSNLGRMKTKSRLIDPPEATQERKSGLVPKSGQMRSGMLGRASGLLGKPSSADDDDDDPFDEDLPDEFKKGKFDALTILQWISLILIVTALACTLSINKLKKNKFRGLSIWKWEVLVLVLICGRLVSGWAIRIIVFFIERNFFMRKRVLYFVYGVRKAVQNCIWLGLVLIAWHSMFDREVQGNNSFLQFVNQIMVCMLVGTLMWLVKTLMVKVLASSFHVSTFFDRIQESLFNQYIIETLSGPPLIEIRTTQEEEARLLTEVCRLQNAGATLPPDLRGPPFHPTKSGKVAGGGGGGLPPRPTRGLSFKFSGQLPKNNDPNNNNNNNNNNNSNDQGGITIDQLQNLNNKNVSAWNMKRLMKVVKHGVLTTLDERVLGNAQGDETATQIRSEQEALIAARNIFRNVSKPRSKYIYIEDLMRFLKEEDALKTLNIVEGSVESEKISKATLKNWVVNTYIERRALALTLNDTKTAVDKLHRMVNIIVGIIILVICLIILEIATSRFLVYLSSQVVVVAFIFGNTCKTIFEAIIFVFVIHPFDVGDRCEVDGVQMIVEEMNILTTVFLRFDNQKIIYPNVTLATRAISNYYRSPDMYDTIDFAVHIATPSDKIATIKQRIISYIENRGDYWYPAPSVVTMDFHDMRTLNLSVWVRHRMNHQNMSEKWKRRAILVEEITKILKELDIEYRLYPVDINIREMPPINSARMPPAWTSPTTN